MSTSRRRRTSRIAASALALGFTVAHAQMSEAVLLFVNTETDGHDAHAGDGVCAAPSGQCTLRAAIEESNALLSADSISVPGGRYHLTEPSDSRAPAPDGLTILDYTEIQGGGPEGTGVASPTIIDGDNKTPIMQVRTIEMFVVDNGYHRVAAHAWNDRQSLTFHSDVSDGIKLIQAPRDVGGLDENYLLSTMSGGVQLFSKDDGASIATVIPPSINGTPVAGADISFGPTAPVAGDIYVSNLLGGGGVYHLSPTRQFLGVLDTGGQPAGAMTWVFQNGAYNLYVIVGNRIARYDVNGNFVGNLAVGVPAPRGLVYNYVTHSFYVSSESDNAIYRYDIDGTSLGAFIGSGSGGLSAPQSLDFAPSGELFVHSRGTDQILRFDGRTGTVGGVVVQGTPGLGHTGSFLFREARADGPLVNIAGVNLANGVSRDFADYSGGLQVEYGAFVQLFNSTIHNCISLTFGAGVYNQGNFVMKSCSVTDNKVQDYASGSGQTSQGGGIMNAGQLFVSDSLIARNAAGRGGGVSTHKFVLTPRTDLVNTTITGNKSAGEGGGVRAALGATVNINFCTITKNEAPVAALGSIPEPYGSGIYSSAGSTIYLANSIVAGNITTVASGQAQYSPDCYGKDPNTVISATDNVIGVLTSACAITDLVTHATPTDLVSGTAASPRDPGIGPLGDNGGLYQTHLLLSGSPAIDRDLTSTTYELYNCGDHDQRYQIRPLDGDGDGVERCDLGAVEVQPATAFDMDGDGIANGIDPAPAQFSFLFSDASSSGNTSGQIMSLGNQLVTINDAATANQGVTLSASSRGGADPAVISMCNDKVNVTLSAGQSKTLTCVTADAGPDQTVQCTGQGKANVTLSGSGAALSGNAVTTAWSAPGVTLQNANLPVASGSFPVGTKIATLVVSRGSERASDTASITVVDTAGPTLTVPADVVASSCTSVSIGQATATDACGAGAVTITNDAPSTFKAGVRIVTWRATDAAGNQTVKTQKITVGLGDNSVCCPAGSHIVVGTSNNDTLTGTAGVDCILGKGGQDTINGLGGDDLISGGDGNDVIDGGDGNDIISGDSGQDTIRGQLGADTIMGGDGDDICYGGDGDDVLLGGPGQDKLYGEAGNDTLMGEDGDDRLEGGDGNDTLNGGPFNDTCLGGLGTNTPISCETVL